MNKTKKITKNKIRKKKSIRKHISGSAVIPRVTVFKSNSYFYAQAIDDDKGVTIVGSKNTDGKSMETTVGFAKTFAAMLKKSKIEKIVFDRNGYNYHGVVKQFADSLRENGIKF